MSIGLVRRSHDGSIELHLGEVERDLLRDVLGQLREALVADAGDPVLARLFPPAYADDPEKEAGFKALARDELLEHRLAAIETVEATVDAERLDAEQADTWMRAINSLRLVLGTRLDVKEDERPDVDPDDPDVLAWMLYELLSLLVDDLVRALEP